MIGVTGPVLLRSRNFAGHSWYSLAMRPFVLFCLIGASALAAARPAVAQRKFRLGPTASVISIDFGASSESFPSVGGSVALLTGDDSETGLTISRYNDLSDNSCERSLTFYGLDSYYYPVGARGLAPFAGTQIGLARVTESQVPLLGGCTSSTPASTSSELGYAFGLGVRVNVGADVAGILEGRFFQVPHSAIQALEARANVSVGFGKPREGDFLQGTLGPAVSFLIPVSGPLEGRGPFFGVRFRRDTEKAGTVGLELDYAPLRVTESCSPPGCEPYAILFAPGYEASLHPRWGRFYGALGLVIAGFPAEGPDRGVAQGAHGGIGVDLYSGRAMWNLNTRLLWLQRTSGENVFGVQVGVSLSPKLVHPKAKRVE